MRDLGSNKREKDVRFEEKRRVVLMKTTCRLWVYVRTEEMKGRKCEGR